MNTPFRDRIIVALDMNDIVICRRLIDALKDTIKIFKVGSELFTACGQEAITIIHERGLQCFLDLKFHDIPNTVANASQIVCHRGVFMFNVHASGGVLMMKAARDAVWGEAEKRGLEKPIILAVTVLTSLSADELQQQLGVSRTLADHVVHLAQMAKEAGLDGVVASAKEIKLIKEKLGDDFKVVTPGIRPHWYSHQDQTRVVEPREAFELGADYIVIGRPITASANPLESAEKIIKELEK
ncbi:MAG: orotidine-5'-phosphate decarboxylase [Candidatus Omnitrophica bacterium]|nr:orotidine-5'-phosphate decarboxylase [Candidatus Omnitrophota bacterium]